MIRMTRYKRKFDCAVCGGTVYYDSVTQIIICKCAQVSINPIPSKELLDNFNELPQVIIESPFGMPKNTWIDYKGMREK
jgi:hypothetical protein